MSPNPAASGLTELLAAGVDVCPDGDVSAVDCAIVGQAIELCLALNGALTALLQTQRWACDPRILLSCAVQGDALDRETRIHAVWCAHRVVRNLPQSQRAVCRNTLIVAWRHARGRATNEELAYAYAAASASATSAAYASAAAYAASSTCS